jgi:hypothetical protein
LKVARYRTFATWISIGGLAFNQRAQPAGFLKLMNTLHIALHDGFQGHTVIVTVEGRVAFNKSSVTTNLAISRADAFDVPVTAGNVRVEVSVQPGGRQGSTQIDVTANPFLAVSLEPDGRIAFQVSAEPFRYM